MRNLLKKSTQHKDRQSTWWSGQHSAGTCVTQHIVRGRSGTVHASRGRSFQERLCKGSGCCTTQHALPMAEPRRTNTPRAKGASWALALARLDRNVAASLDHWPPTSVPRTTRRGLPCSPDNSGCLLAFHTLATSKAFPLMVAAPAVPLLRTGETMVVSMANCAPFRKQLTTTSNLCPSNWLNSWRSMSHTRTFTRTRPLASRHTRAATFSRTQPRRPKTPAVPHAARWWPRTSRGQPHRQARADRGKGRPEAAEEQNVKRLRCQTKLLDGRDGCEQKS